MADKELKRNARTEVMSRRVLSFKLWRDSVDTSVFDEDELKKLRDAEEKLQGKFEELDVEPSVSTKLNKEEAEALFAVEEVLEKKMSRRKPRQQSMNEQPIEAPRNRKGRIKNRESPKLPPRKSEQAQDGDEEDVEEQKKGEEVEDKRLKQVKEEDDNSAYPSVTLKNLPKGHVAEKAKTFGSKGSSSSSAMTKSGIKKLL